MNAIAIAFDIGGTNSRARVAALEDGGMPRQVRADVVSEVASASELQDFISQVVQTAETDGHVSTAVVAVAGPVLGTESHLTNWPTDSSITLQGLENAGLPSGRTHLVNDVVAGAWGALARIEAGAAGARLRPPARGRDEENALGDGTLVYVAPGTGLGAAAIVRHHLGPVGASSLGCEAQHAQMPAFAGPIGEVTDALAVALGHAPSWEDLISGRGLTRIYDAECAIASTVPLYADIDDARRAGAVASAALSGEDALAVAAIDAFYRALGYFAQTLALSFLPCAAVAIGGASTENNLDLLRRSGLAEAFADNRHLGDLLVRTPLHTVGGEVNLEGGIWLGAHL